MERIKHIILALAAILLTAVQSAAQARYSAMAADETTTLDDPASGAKYTINMTQGYATLTGVGDNGLSSTELIVPETFEEYPVVEIGKEAFKDNTQLTKVTINSKGKDGEGLLINNYAFYQCTSLTDVVINGCVSFIGKSAFNGCSSLASINLPEGLTVLGDCALLKCAIKELSTPSTLVAIRYQALQECANLTTLDLSNGLDSICEQAFYKDPKLDKLILPITLKYIGKNAFYGNNGIKELTVPKSVSSIEPFCFFDCYGIEKISFEGGELKDINDHVFANCEGLKELILGDGIEYIDEYAFSGCDNLESITLPKSVIYLSENLFEGCDKLSTVKIYKEDGNYDKESNEGIYTSSETFSYITKKGLSVKLLVPVPDKYSDFADYFTGGIEKLFTFAETTDSEEQPTTATTTDAQSTIDAFNALSNADGSFADIDVTIGEDVTFTKPDFDLESLSAKNIFSVIDKLPTIDEYNGTLQGATLTNLAVRSEGIFNHIGESAVINNLAFDNATVYVDPTSENYHTSGDTVYVYLLAKRNSGQVNCFTFSGNVIVDEDLAKDKEIVVCLVDTNDDDATLTGILRLDDIVTTGSGKRCIIIKQNLGLRSGTGTKVKVAKSRTNGNTKSLTIDGDDNSGYEREFTDEQFANGEAAYWLNWDGPDFTGNYTARWSQGKTLPIAATTTNGVSNALHKVDYGTTDFSHITSYATYANGGSSFTIGYDEKPESVTIGGSPLANFGASSVTITGFDPAKQIVITFTAQTTDPTATKQVKGIGITTSGREIIIYGAEAETKSLYSLTGLRIATTTGNTLSTPCAGIYIVRVGDKMFKIGVK